MRNFLFVCVLTSLLLAPVARADIVFDWSVDTSSISGTAGSLDFQFNPGPLVTQAASLQVLNFSSDGALAGSPALTGDVSGGPLPATLTFDNGTAFNDYFEDFTFGSTLSFAVDFFGPAVDSPDGISTSGSAFAFSMFSDSQGTVPVLTSDTTDGFAAVINLNLDGTGTPTSFSTQTTITPESIGLVPEPADAEMLAAVFPGLVYLLWPYLKRKERDR